MWFAIVKGVDDDRPISDAVECSYRHFKPTVRYVQCWIGPFCFRLVYPLAKWFPVRFENVE